MGGLILLLLGASGAALALRKRHETPSPGGAPTAADIAQYKSVIAYQTDPVLLDKLATALDMASLKDLAGQARARAAALRGATAQVTPDKMAAYQQSIAQQMDPAVLDQLAQSFDMAGMSDLGGQARTRARALRSTAAGVATAPAPGVSANPFPAAMAGGDLTLSPGVLYRARLALGFIQCLGSREQLVSVLSSLGFQGVRVFMDPSELPVDWPGDYREARGVCARWAEGTWGGSVRVIARPDEIEAVWSDASAPAAHVGHAREYREKGPCRCSS